MAQHAWRCEPPLGSFIIWDNAAVIVMVPHLQFSCYLKTYLQWLSLEKV